MKDLIFISGNQNKADYLAKWLERPIAHHKLDLDEIQSLNLRAVVEHKAKQAYQVMQQPVLVEDVALTFTAMGRLPGTLIKWFLEELGNDGLCKLADGLDSRNAMAEIMYGLHDGTDTHFFQASSSGQVAKVPRGSHGFGWNSIFIPDGYQKTFAEMTGRELHEIGFRSKAIANLRQFLEQN
jgi:non-canonical purine NTP pyrophosphatase (RdgB/HAM1 family)